MKTKITDLVTMDEVKLNMAQCTWHAMRGVLHLWTPEVANAQPYCELYEKKYFASRLPYTMKYVMYAHSAEVVNSYGYVKEKVTGVTREHFIGSYTVGECAFDNPDIYLADGTFDTFSMELYPYTFLANWVTKEQNELLSTLKGAELTKDKYTKLGIQLLINGDVVENPELPEGFTEWEDEKYFPNSIFKLCA